jgi:hypothetical protein
MLAYRAETSMAKLGEGEDVRTCFLETTLGRLSGFHAEGLRCILLLSREVELKIPAKG